ncbi:hypothetical protein QTP88_029298 [Uroleucon formosanum]
MKLNNENINVMRTRAKENLENQAKKIIAWSDKKLLPFSVHSTIRVPFSEVDKGHLDARSILAIVLEIINKFKNGTGDPVLKQLYARSQFTRFRKYEKQTAIESSLIDRATFRPPRNATKAERDYPNVALRRLR